MGSLFPPSRNTQQDHTFYTSLLASALSNPSSGAHSRHTATSRSHPMPHIVHRIQNCVIIANHISPRTESSSEDLLNRFCVAASTSRYCQRYMYAYRQSRHELSWTYTEADAYLEIALLVACEYRFEDVKYWMLELLERRVLMQYRQDGVLRAMVSYCRGTRDNW
jgi:hypothetical protein